MNRGITKENLLLIMPPALTRDKSIMALAAADAEALAARLEEIDRVRIISNIDGLDEAVLDILARDFKVDWYDPDYSLEEKRRTVKSSWRVHKTLGTKAAVERAIFAMYSEAKVEEWFEYGGEPYHFRLRINLANDSGDITKQRRVFQRLNFYKSLRSHVDEVKYFLKPEKVWAYAGAAFMGSRREAAAYIPITVTPPGSRAEILAGGGLLGAYLHIRTTAEVGPMKAVGGSAAAGGGAALSGAYQKISTVIDIPGQAGPSCGRAEARTGCGLCGMYMRRTLAAGVQASVHPPHITAAAGVSAGLGGVYQKIIREVAINGTLDRSGGNK